MEPAPLKEMGYDPEKEAEQSKGEAQDAAESMLTAFDRGQGMPPGVSTKGGKPDLSEHED